MNSKQEPFPGQRTPDAEKAALDRAQAAAHAEWQRAVANNPHPLEPYPNEAGFAAFAEQLLRDVLHKLHEKGSQYGDNGRHEPAWQNYREIGAFLHQTTGSAIFTALLKHGWTAARWAEGHNDTPDIRERIIDMIVYLLLLDFWGINPQGREQELKP